MPQTFFAERNSHLIVLNGRSNSWVISASISSTDSFGFSCGLRAWLNYYHTGCQCSSLLAKLQYIIKDMEHHQYFDLQLHNNSELEMLLGRCISKRKTLHEWPLSYVQRLEFSDGSTMIYKSSSGPTVEPEFYVRVRFPLLVGAQTLYRDERYACMLLEDVKAPLLEQKELTEEEALRIGSDLLAGISQVEGPRCVSRPQSMGELAGDHGRNVARPAWAGKKRTIPGD